VEKAVYWYRKAAEQGDKSGQYNLGVAYFNGKGVAPDGKEAGAWLEKAALQGDKDAALQLFHLNSDGKLLPENKAKAFCWMQVVRNGVAPTTCSGL
jgi:TPR repeat protein